MRPTRHVLRDDDRYYVVVGWDATLQSFYAYARDGSEDEGETEPLLNIGRAPHDVPTISALAAAVSRFARLEPLMISALRHDADPLGGTDPEWVTDAGF